MHFKKSLLAHILNNIYFFIEPGFLSDWNEWTDCAEACPRGNGEKGFPTGSHQKRNRTCVLPEANSAPCGASLKYDEKKACSESDCPRKF